ncbi:Single-stranded-DNA-specific exonuclease RecJ [Achromobacter anxifer]|uniref:single-stranded-DNA-specific exonuclease RecJ n=1 Tax=Achromobacter anxifer TaxID=1287737 RepID=UPI00155BBEAB|nr:Single-stranded-DNA-specific exonuclease RecJ [Achromobacter anxifer]
MTAARPLTIEPRRYPASSAYALTREGVPPLLARVLAGRGLTSQTELGYSLGVLAHHSALLGAQAAASYIADAIADGRRFVVIADYDCDGATACAVAVRGLRAFGANAQYVVPDRMIHGYGLTPSVVALACERYPDVDTLITVDNGVASHAGVQAAVDRGLDVLVTDHHLPAKGKPLPPARVIVDPSQPGCPFPSKALAGVGVIWYVLWALQDEFRARGLAPATPGFKVSQLLSLVAVGTVADVVPLDMNNRALVHAGLARIKEGNSYPGIEALAANGFPGQPLRPERTDLTKLVTSDIAFGIGPRINAAGRLETMDIGIECLTTDDPKRALALAQELAEINQTRKDIEHETVLEAVAQAEALIASSYGASAGAERRTLCVHSPDWHAGVIGIVAGRIKEKRYRPTFVITTDPDSGEMKGSGRSIPGFNLKDALDQVDKEHPGLMVKFGGHAMAAGLTLRPGGFETFRDAFEAEARRTLPAELLDQQVEYDGSLTGSQLRPATAHELRGPAWGQMFPEPSFCDEFRVLESKIGGARKDQLAMVVERDGVELKAVRFRHEGTVPEIGSTVRLVYKLQLKADKQGNDAVSLLLDHVLSA